MIKQLSIAVVLTSSLFSQEFSVFLENAVKNSPYLKSTGLSISQAQVEGKILSRFENPSLELQVASFSPDTGKSDNGYTLGYSQEIPLWGITDQKDKFSKSKIKTQVSQHILSHTEFIRDISSLYIEYVQMKRALTLGSQELEIAQYIYDISSERYKVGTISRGTMLQARVDFEMVSIKIEAIKLQEQKSYYKLLKFAGEVKEVDIDETHEFTLKSADVVKSPELLLLKSTYEEKVASTGLYTSSVQSIELSAELESEPEQDIFRVALAIPLAIFDTRSEEKQIALLQAKKSKFLIQREETKLDIEKINLQKQREFLKSLKSKNESTLKTQEELLQMFQEAYKIANINLLELQNIKNGVIQTKENLIKIRTLLDQNTIQINYISGAYNG